MLTLVRRAVAKPSRARLGLVLILGALPLLVGCPNAKKVAKSNARQEEEDHLAIAQSTLRKNADIEACKSAVAQLNVAVARLSDAKPEPLTAAEHELFAKQLDDDDFAEINRPNFTTLDAHYLESALLFHEAMQSLNLDFADKSAAGLRKRAEIAFAWAMREVWLLDRQLRPLPPSYVMQMGFANYWERNAVALEALRQTGLDAGLVGQASGNTLKPWAIGVRVDDQVYLFDARAGVPVPSADGKDILTLKQARTEPDRVKSLVTATDPAADAKAVVASSRIYLSPPLPALAPRMRWLQGALNANPPAVLGVQPLEEIARFAKAGEKAEFWGPAPDVTAPMRLLQAFLPPAEGGREQGKPGSRPIDFYMLAVVPSDQMPAVIRSDKITNEARTQFEARFRGRFLDTAFAREGPRSLLLRGQFDQASHILVERLQAIDNVRRRVASEPKLEADALAWLKELNAAEADFFRIKNRTKEGDLDAAKERLDLLNKSGDKFQLLIEQSAADPFAAVLTFQIALCKHEQAERLSRDHGKAAAHRDAWQDAAGWWNNFLTHYSTAAWLPKPQIAHARQLLAAAKQESTLDAATLGNGTRTDR